MKKILLIIIPVILLMLAFRPVNPFVVSGKVTDDKGNPLATVTIMAKGTKNAVTSQTDGTYKITVTDKNATLFFSALGYNQQEIKIEGRSTINVVLVSSVQNLEEVVVTGYATQKKMSITGSVATINGYTNYSPYSGNALQGKAPGIQVVMYAGF